MLRKIYYSLFGNFTDNNEKLAKVNFGIIICMFVISAVMLFFLPEEISLLHVGGTKYPIPTVIGVWLFPVLALIVNVSFIRQKRLSKLNSVVFAALLVVSTIAYFTMM